MASSLSPTNNSTLRRLARYDHQILRKKTITTLIIVIPKVNLGHNDSVCDNLGEFPEIQMKSQKLIAAVQVISKAARLAHIFTSLAQWQCP